MLHLAFATNPVKKSTLRSGHARQTPPQEARRGRVHNALLPTAMIETMGLAQTDSGRRWTALAALVFVFGGCGNGNESRDAGGPGEAGNPHDAGNPTGDAGLA